MECELRDDVLTAGSDAVEELYDRGFYGRVKDGKLELSLIEGAYLLSRGKIEIFSDRNALDFKAFFEIASDRIKDFELGYIVFKDLRERGYYTKMSPIGFRIYPRGGHPGKTPAHVFVYVISERAHLPLQRMISELNKAENARKRLILAIVDEESDITFYELKNIIIADFLHQNYFFGKKLDELRLQLSLVESGYLLDKQWIRIKHKNAAEFNEYAEGVEPGYTLKYLVYSNLRDRGFVVKTGFKFGTHFRVYKQFKTDAHSEYLVHTIASDYVFALPELSRAVRIANTVHKRMVFGYPDDATGDEAGRVGYVEVGWIRL
jgi:tRNA-intron endonuclease